MRSTSFGLVVLGLLLASIGCGGSKTPSAPPPPSVSPTAPSAPTPTTVSLSGGWSGTFSDEDGSGTMRWQVSSQSGGTFTGGVVVVQNSQSASGTLSGSIASSAVTFQFRFDDCAGGCPATGTATVSDASIAGSYKATNARSATVNGQFALSRIPF